MSEVKLRPKQARFVDEYLIDLNATQAAIRAGYSEKTAEQMGYQLLQKTSVSAAIQNCQQQRSERTEITADYVLTKIKGVIERATSESDTYDATAALRGAELLGKHLAMWTEKQTVDHTTGGKPLPPPPSTASPELLREIVKQVMDEY